MLLSAGIGDNSTRGYYSLAQCPQKLAVPDSLFVLVFNLRKGFCDAFVGVIHVLVNKSAFLVFKAIFVLPDIKGSVLEFDFVDARRYSG